MSKRILATILLTGIFLTACGGQAAQPTETPTAVPATATATPQPLPPTNTPTELVVPVTGESPTPSATPTEFVPNNPADCVNKATFVTDVTIPDNTEMKPGNTFTKTWQIQNTGTCDWNENFKFTFVGGDLFGSDTTKIRRYIGSGSTLNVSLKMVAPSGSGTVTSSWRMADDSGNLFGQIFTVQIVLK